MKLSDVFAKIAGNTPLTPAEVAFLRSQADLMQSSASSVSGWFTGGEARISSISFGAASFDVPPLGAIVLQGTVASLTNKTWTDFTFSTAYTGNSPYLKLLAAGTDITRARSLSGKMFLVCGHLTDDSSGGLTKAQYAVRFYLAGSSMFTGNTIIIPPWNETISIVEGPSFTGIVLGGSGDSIRFQVWQNSGGTLTMGTNITLCVIPLT